MLEILEMLKIYYGVDFLIKKSINLIFLIIKLLDFICQEIKQNVKKLG